MEAIVAIFELPGGQLVLDLVSIGLCIWLVRDIRSTRSIIHKRINTVHSELSAHETECADRWGQVKTKLDIHQ